MPSLAAASSVLPAVVIFAYLAVVLFIGIFAFRRRSSGEDFFLANRSIGSAVFFLSLFATNMTAFAILGSSGMSYRIGVGVYGLMASSSCFVIPLTLFVIGTRLWGLGKRFGHMTQVQFFRDRWECSEIGTVIFALTALMLLPYLIISITGGGLILEALTGGAVRYAAGGAIVALVVMGNVFFGGMRGAVLVNVFQTLLFLSFGCVAFVVIGHNVPGGFVAAVRGMADDPKLRHLLTCDTSRITERQFFSYLFIPLSSIMFPHMAIMCLTARKVTAFRKTVVAYPISILLLWLPCVFLGAVGAKFLKLDPAHADQILPEMLKLYAGPALAGILGAGIISAVMGSDCHQILALSTMFTKDVVGHYGRADERQTVFFGRVFIVLMNGVAFAIAMFRLPIFELAVQYAFSGFAALSPVMLAALFWRRSTKWGALAATLFVAACILATALLEHAAAPGSAYGHLGGQAILSLARPTGSLRVLGFLPVVPMVFGSAVCVVLASLLTRPPSEATVRKYFGPVTGREPTAAPAPRAQPA